MSKNEGNMDKVSAWANNIYIGSLIVTNMDNNKRCTILSDIRYIYIGVILFISTFYKHKYLKLCLLQNQLGKPQKSILTDRLVILET